MATQLVEFTQRGVIATIKVDEDWPDRLHDRLPF